MLDRYAARKGNLVVASDRTSLPAAQRAARDTTGHQPRGSTGISKGGAPWLVSCLVAVASVALLAVHLLDASSLDAPGLVMQEGESQMPAARGDVERGRYLVENVSMCGECHSTRDAAGTIVAHLRFMGGPMPVTAPRALDFPLYIPRIAGLPGYTDDQAVRLLTEGAIKRDGTQLRPPMPRFRMTPDDAAAVIAYLRSL